MTDWNKYRTQFNAKLGAKVAEDGTVAQFAELHGEYAALGEGLAIVDRRERAILDVEGSDRVSWLHNLTTNVVKSLMPGDGRYAFATNQQGRILFDLNLLVRPEFLRLDIARTFLDAAQSHLQKYIIMEDVRLRDRSGELVVFGLAGSRSGDVAAGLGVSQMVAMPELNCVEISFEGADCLFIRHDFCGTLGFELHVPVECAAQVWDAMIDSNGSFRAIPVGAEAVEVRRIEAGIPRSGKEITNDYLPAETMQFDRAVSFQKGCYLGQEVIERMRTREKVARQLVRFELTGATVPAEGDPVILDSDRVGVVTSSITSPAGGGPLALGYVKTAAAQAGTEVIIENNDEPLPARIARLSRPMITEA